MNHIKRAVSLYSYQDQYARKRMNLEDMFREMKDMGVEGVELISDQMIHNAPNPSEESIRKWREYTEKYGIPCICNDVFINSTLYHNRRLSIPEQVELLKAELHCAHKLGFSLIRLVSNTDAALLEPVLPLAERLQITMALEIHGGMSFQGELTKRFISEMKRLQSPYLGLVLDMSIFSRRHPRVAKNYFMQLGLNPALAEYIDDVFENRHLDPLQILLPTDSPDPTAAFPEDMRRLCLNPIDVEYGIFAGGYENTPVNVLDEYLPYICHIHGKCYEMTQENNEYSLAYDEIVPYLQRKGYQGYIATEYEGNRFVTLHETVDAVEQVRRHQRMLQKLLNE